MVFHSCTQSLTTDSLTIQHPIYFASEEVVCMICLKALESTWFNGDTLQCFNRADDNITVYSIHASIAGFDQTQTVKGLS